MFNTQLLKKVAPVNLRRITDGAVFQIASPCVLQLPGELVRVSGAPNEELDTDIWDVTRHFEVESYATNP